MRRAFGIFIAICFIVFSVDGRFVYFRLSLGCGSRWDGRYQSKWESLDRSQDRFQPIKFVNSVVPSLWDTSI